MRSLQFGARTRFAAHTLRNARRIRCPRRRTLCCLSCSRICGWRDKRHAHAARSTLRSSYNTCAALRQGRQFYSWAGRFYAIHEQSNVQSAMWRELSTSTRGLHLRGWSGPAKLHEWRKPPCRHCASKQARPCDACGWRSTVATGTPERKSALRRLRIDDSRATTASAVLSGVVLLERRTIACACQRQCMAHNR